MRLPISLAYFITVRCGLYSQCLGYGKIVLFHSVLSCSKYVFCHLAVQKRSINSKGCNRWLITLLPGLSLSLIALRVIIEIILTRKSLSSHYTFFLKPSLYNNYIDSPINLIAAIFLLGLCRPSIAFPFCREGLCNNSIDIERKMWIVAGFGPQCR